MTDNVRPTNCFCQRPSLNLAEIERVTDAATRGPWMVTADPLGIHVENGDGQGRIVMRSGQDRIDGCGPANAEFIANARQWVSTLVSMVWELQGERVWFAEQIAQAIEAACHCCPVAGAPQCAHRDAATIARAMCTSTTTEETS